MPFVETLRQFAEDLRRNFAAGIPAQPEDQLKPGVQEVLRAAARFLAVRTNYPGRPRPNDSRRARKKTPTLKC
mgnify:CR=1 FL=1